MQLIGKRCFGGLDLSSTTDLTAFALLFPPQDGLKDWRLIVESWIPEDCMKERIARDGVPYDKWVKSKHLHVTPGNVIDYEFVEARILSANQQYKIEMLGTDPWNSRMLTQRLDKGGVKLYEVPQNMAYLSPAMKEMERLMKSEKYTHESNPVTRWCFGNMVVAMDGNGNIKPMKNKAVERIDAAVAAIIAMSVAIQMGATIEKCPYNENRGIILL
jgi:phage terminase large subunit-like protein